MNHCHALLCAVALLAALFIAAIAAAQPPSSALSPQMQRGADLYQKHCALCHGVEGRDGTVFPRPIWGPGHDLRKFNSARGLQDYLLLLMPFDDPAKMSDDEKLAVTAYMLMRNGDLQPGQAITAAQAATTPIR